MLSNTPEYTAFDKAGRANHKDRLATGKLRGKRGIANAREGERFLEDCVPVHQTGAGAVRGATASILVAQTF